MAFSVSRRQLPAQPAAVLRGSAPAFELANLVGDLLPRVAIAAGESMAGPPFVRYHSLDPAAFNVEVGIPVQPPFPFDPAVGLIELPACAAVTTWHEGDYSTIPGTILQLRAAIREDGEQPAGFPWEVYWPGDAGSTRPRTEIIQPLATSRDSQ